jgi:hypothetical protein
MTHARAGNDTKRYEIRVRGRLDDRWAAWFDSHALAPGASGTTLIETGAVDQAALHGLLRQVRDAGLALISVTQIDPTTD